MPNGEQSKWIGLGLREHIEMMKHGEQHDPAVDVIVLSRLYDLMGYQAFIQLLESFITRCGENITHAVDSLQREDLEKLHFFAHTLKGSSGNLGCTALSASCAILDQGAREHWDSDKLRIQLEHVALQFEQAKQDIGVYYESLQPGFTRGSR